MAIVTKKISGREYSYVVKRRGGRVVTKYLGPKGSPDTIIKESEYFEIRSVPARFRALFWDTDPERIDIRKNAIYIIERALEMGSLDALWWMQRLYTTDKILDVVNESRALDEKSRSFWRVWFGRENI